MNQPRSETKISVACPSGHRLRGGAELVGKTVKCPKCTCEFIFAPTRPVASENPAVTDTGVMRILGDMPQSQAPPMKFTVREGRAVTDTGVMRILGNMSQSPPTQSRVTMRPCPRCNVATPESAAVCTHCNCYLGVMPTFLQQMTRSNEVESS